MLSAPSQYRDILRVIGRLLDEREAVLKAEATDSGRQTDPTAEEPKVGYEDVEIVEHETFVRVSWRTRDGSAARQAYTELNLSRLRARARQLRSEKTSDPAGEREDLLRTLGQELDAEELRVSGIFEKDSEFFVSGSDDGRYVSRSYTKDQLLTLGEHRKQLRAEPHPVARPEAEATGHAASTRSHWLLWANGATR